MRVYAYGLVTMALFFLASLILIIAIPITVLFSRKSKVKYSPGPMALPIIGHLHLLSSPLLHQSFSKLSSRYGPLMYLRLGSQPVVVVSSPEMISAVFKNHDLAFSQRQESFTSIKKLNFGVLGFGFSPYGPYWTFIKKLAITELLGPKALQRTTALRTRELHYLIGNLLDKSKARESVNLTKEFHKLTGNNMSMMLFSKRFMTTPSETDEFMALVSSVTGIPTVMDMTEMFLGPLRKYSRLRKRVRHTFRRLHDLIEKFVADREHMRRNKDDHHVPKDFLDTLLDLVDANTDEVDHVKITRKHVKALVMNLLVGATDSTAITVDWAMVELLRHPEIMKKAQEEVDQVAGSQSRIVNESDYECLSYIVAIVKETFRLHPTVPLMPRLSTQECTINGFTVQSGVVLAVNMWAIGRDPKVWDSPMDFRPERFLSDHATAFDVTNNDYQLLPFGTGRRRCPAINMSMEIVTTTLASLVQCFDWELAGHVSLSSMDMSERPGLIVTRGEQLECFPLARYTPKLVHQW